MDGGRDLGCYTPSTDAGIGDESCEGLTEDSWAEVAARRAVSTR